MVALFLRILLLTVFNLKKTFEPQSNSQKQALLCE